MGTLISKDQIPDPTFYFEDAYPNRDRLGKFEFEWPNPGFSHICAIHSDDFAANVRVRVREWIERNLFGTVIYDTLDLSYTRYFGEVHTYDKSYTKGNHWFVFCFSDSESLLAFSIVFGYYIKPLTRYHPDSPEDDIGDNALFRNKGKDKWLKDI